MGLVSQLSKRPLNLKLFPYIYRALEETIDFDEAIEMVINMVNLDETLIIVTADHSHTFTISGYSDRGSDIRGLASRTLDDGLPYSILSYANGPSFNNFYYAQNGQVKRKNLSKIRLKIIKIRLQLFKESSIWTKGGSYESFEIACEIPVPK